MGRMGGDTKLEADHHGDPSPGPHVSPKPIGGRPPLEECGSAGELRARQTPCSSGRRAMPKRLGALLADACHPLADRPFADAERLGNPPLRPAARLEAPGLEPSGFFPVGRCAVHAWQCTTTAEKL
jgi:hypothetical protein